MPSRELGTRIPAAHEPDALLLKSRMFINRALDSDREFEEQAFWAASALELLGKCALAQVNPLLIANPQDDGNSLLVASGAIESGRFFSVQAKAVWARCARAFPPFSVSEATKISTGRNDYIHAGAVGFDSIPPAQWWTNFWRQAAILLEHCGSSVSEYVGHARSGNVERHIAAGEQQLRDQLQAILETTLQRRRMHESGLLTAARAVAWNQFTVEVSRYSADATCPACAGDAVISGEEVLDYEVEHDWRERTASIRLIVATELLSCPACHLTLTNPELIDLAEVDTSFDAEGDENDLENYMDEPEYNNE